MFGLSILAIICIVALLAYVYYQYFAVKDFRQCSALLSYYAAKWLPPNGKNAYEDDANGIPRRRKAEKPTQAEATAFQAAAILVSVIIAGMTIGLYILFSVLAEVSAAYHENPHCLMFC